MANQYKISNEVSIDRKPEKISKFQAKINFIEKLPDGFLGPANDVDVIGGVSK
jgi:hypothetical protein